LRELKTPQQISDWITERLQAFAGCADATVIIQYEIQEPASDGCNWSEDLVLNYGTSQREVVLQHLRPLHREARRRFNVSEARRNFHPHDTCAAALRASKCEQRESDIDDE